MIADAIEEDMDHVFRDNDKDSQSPRQPFYRAIDQYIKTKFKGAKTLHVEPVSESLVVPASQVVGKNPETRSSKRKKLNTTEKVVPLVTRLDKKELSNNSKALLQQEEQANKDANQDSSNG